jgi:hypothetical protein
MYLRPHFLLALLLILYACNYEPEESVLTEVSPPTTDDISIEVPLNKSDTIFLFKPTQISYRSILGIHKPRQIRVLLNGDELLTSVQPNGSFNFYTPNYPNGTHRLSIELRASGGSGSLADTQGKEEILIEREYTLNIDHAVPNSISFTNFRLENGSLKVSWLKYTRRNFQHYDIYKHCYNSFSKQYETCWRKKLISQQTTSLIDSSFIGGKVKYSIAVHGAEQTGPYTEKEFEVAYDPQLKWTWLNNEEVKLTWTKPPCYSSFTSYELRYGSYDEEKVITIDKLSDTVLTFTPGLKFGAYQNIAIYANPYRVNTYNKDYIVSQASIYLGIKFPSRYDGSELYSKALDKYFIVRTKSYNAYELVRVNAHDYSEEQKLDIFTTTISLSDNGADLYLAQDDILKKIDPLTFTTIKTFDLSTLERTTWTEWTLNISDNNILAATNYGGSYVVDMNTFTVIQRFSYDFSTMISPNGTYLVRKSEILKLENGQYVTKMSIPESSSDGKQFVSNDRFLLPVQGTLLVIDLNTFSVANKILVEGRYLGYDPVSEMASSSALEYDADPNRIFLYTLDVKEAVKAIKIAGYVRLINNSLVGDGLIMPLSAYYP